MIVKAMIYGESRFDYAADYIDYIVPAYEEYCAAAGYTPHAY
jgi:hypothetical protein